MKYLIASDLHGSAACCKALLDAYERERADQLLLLGDILGDGPEDDAVAEMLNALADRIRCARGNCDTLSLQEKLAFPMRTYHIIPVMAGVVMYATHGHIYSGERRPGDMRPGDVLIHGHTHYPVAQKRADFYCFNPGSVAQPRGDSQRGYMTMEGGLFLWKTLDGEELRQYKIEPHS